MKENYILFVLQSYAAEENFDTIFGDHWLQEESLDDFIATFTQRAFAQYGIDSGLDFFSASWAVFNSLMERKAVLKEGDEYSGMWFKLRPDIKTKAVDELLKSNPATTRVRRQGDEALQKALLRIAKEHGLGSLTDESLQSDDSPIDRSSADTSDAYKRDFFRSPENQTKFIALTDAEIEKVEHADLSNSERSQAQGYLMAVRALSETPEPPVDLIWQLLSRANSVAGIGSFFVSLITLLAAVVG